ncbi:hypothetical protein H8S90_17760 [Olivibacter sp. SDN3]|uniref:UbiA family prenyltransferase n=1 Tax=Olivibacter sp. SDN3 TaxID=2764720 RepID=UPI0016513A7A|nr:UbiA family prenyltransferase [Olivibacter sp. SDN3]QNL48618.1 hypothetical protein H8S90_17760 [Olivibacter sp. SDN3]
MVDRLIKFFFFGNIFVALLAVALSLEATIQLALPFNSTAYYLILFSATLAYYTYAYTKIIAKPSYAMDPRTYWYATHRKFTYRSLRLSIIICALLLTYIIVSNFNALLKLPLFYWSIIVVIILTGLLYYGLVPGSFIKLNTRNTGLFKSFVIGFVWACCVNLLPLVMLKIEQQVIPDDWFLVGWLFLKTFMFCTVNAIIFDIKDYAADANKQLKTFVVQFGLRNTIFRILIPLLLIGVVAMIFFAKHRHFGLVPLVINICPFALSLVVAYSMHKRQNILYYLIVIDGLLLVKAVCGITALYYVN